MAKQRNPPLDPALSRRLIQLEREIQAADVRAAVARRRRRSMVDDGHVYVVEFASGVVKVGKAVDPEARLASHAKFAQIHGNSIRRSWTSTRHNDCSSLERQLIEFCKQRGVCVFGREYFKGVEYAEVRRFGDAIAYRDMCHEMHDSFGRTVAQIDTSVNRMIEGADGDLDANAIEAWRRATGQQS